MTVLDKVLRAGEGRKFRKFAKEAQLVNAFEPEIKALSDAELAAKTAEFRQRLDRGEELDDLLPEAYAAVREAAWRVIGQRHFDVQVIGATVLHHGAIAEMRTGEGKTLVSTMPIYLNALLGRGVHAVTANSYLAKRDAEWMGQIFRFLSLHVGLIQPQSGYAAKQAAYQAEITYGTASEFGFDYLRDNLALSLRETVQRQHYFCIVDEVDSILIDEARTPLIISGAADESAKWYKTFARIMPRLQADVHYEVDEAKRTVAINEEGIARVESLLGVDNLYDQVQTHLVHYLDSALKAKELYKRDRDYVIQDRKVVIVDQFTGRTMPSRRWSDGLHQAVEAKENVTVQEESVTEATITIQKYFQMYEKLSGMTGTALTQATEFAGVYNLDVYQIPTNRDMIREDHSDLVYKTEDAKWKALTEDLVERNAAGQPVLVGTVDVAKSEKVSGYLERRGVPHQVLNAKNHEKEAFIVAQAGRVGAVVVATNMAGRGVDILLGGNPEYLARQEMQIRGWDIDAYMLELMEPEDKAAYEKEYEPILAEMKIQCEAEHEKVIDLGGLYVLGTERHESRRIDNQLRGRAGRQGDPGESQFYLSLDDDLMRFFATNMISNVMDRMNVPEEMPIEAKMVSKAIERAQSQVESQNFEIRKNLLKYDEVLSLQREEVYRARRKLLEGEDLSERSIGMIEDVITDIVDTFASQAAHAEDWDWEGLESTISQLYPSKLPGTMDHESTVHAEMLDAYLAEAEEMYHQREDEIGHERFRELERLVLLSILNARWREHLYEMDQLREGIGLRAYGQRDPLTEYQREGFDMFTRMMDSLKEEFVRYMFHVQVVDEQKQAAAAPVKAAQAAQESAMAGAKARAGLEGTQGGTAGEPARSEKIGRNAPCPCGSGKKYKMCHGRGAQPCRTYRKTFSPAWFRPPPSLTTLRSSFDIEAKRSKALTLQEKTLQPGFWDEQAAAARTMTELSRIEDDVKSYLDLSAQHEEAEVLWQLGIEESDVESAAEAISILDRLDTEMGRLEIRALLSGEYDEADAIASLNAGEGGTESCDWANMLLRMYLRWAERHEGLEAEVLDVQPGEEAGIKSATFRLKGRFAYGLLSTERGVHRLVRISPFDASSRRHTSFASLDVIPEVVEAEEVDIDPGELRIDVYRSGGPGGQSVNTTDSAIRITHLPTNIVVTVQNERSQLQNKAVAMKVLAARLADRARREKQKEMDQLRGEQMEIGFGSQIRSYVLHPYQMVKDRRTEVEVGNPEAVLDGDIDVFIDAELRRRRTGHN